MGLVIVGLAVMLIGGLLAVLVSFSSRLSNWLGGLSAVSGTVIACVPAVKAITTGHTVSLGPLTWNVPYGSFWLELDPLSAWFLTIILGLSALAAVYGIEYMSQYGGRKNLGAV